MFKSKKKEDKKFMCKKLKEIHGLSPNDICREYELEKTVDMQGLLEDMEIKCMDYDFTPLEERLCFKGNDVILGMACAGKDDLLILHSSRLNDKEKNYVLAHELAHCCIHLPVSSEYHIELKTKNDIYPIMRSLYFLINFKNRHHQKEEEADCFAAELLIPTSEIMNVLSSDNVPTIHELSNYFCVPNYLVRLKIKLLNQTFSGSPLKQFLKGGKPLWLLKQ